MASPKSFRGFGNRRRLILFIQAALVSVVAAIGIALSELPANLDNTVFPACVLVSVIAVWNFWSWRLLGREWFGPYGLFLMSASLFNGGQAFLEVLGLNVNGVLAGHYAPELTVKALYLIALGLAALHLGAIGAIRKPAVRTHFRPRPSDDERDRASRAVGWSCLLISAFPNVLVLRDMLSVVASRGYTGLTDRPVEDVLPASIRLLAGFLVPGVMFLAAGSRRHRHSLTLAAIVMAVYSGIVMYSGMRRLGAPLFISFVWLYHSRIRRLPRAAILSTGVALLALFTLVSEVRNEPGPWLDAVQKARATSSAAQNPIVGAITEMGNTAGTVADTINLWPAARPFDYGIGYGYALLTLIPNVGWAVHPTAARGTYSEWLTRMVELRTDVHGGGFGYSFIAEPFANFGWYGVVPLLVLTGYLLVKMFEWATLTDDPAKYAAVATFIVPLLFFPRAETAELFRPLVYYSLLSYVAAGLWTKRFLSKSRAGQPQRIAPRVTGRRPVPGGQPSLESTAPRRGSLANSSPT
jgi:hypothetical protein